MAEHNPNPWQQRALPEAVAASTGPVAWTVRCAPAPLLPAEVAAMVAPSIVVTASPAAPGTQPAPAARSRVEPRPHRMDLPTVRTLNGRHRRPAHAG